MTPAVEGWFLDGDDPSLLGGRCGDCGTVAFPPREAFCPNPGCDGAALDLVPLSRRARVWSWTTNHYDPPPPAVVTAPYTVVAATLEAEAMTVLGLLAPGADVADLAIGALVEVATTDLDLDGAPRRVWAWRPVARQGR